MSLLTNIQILEKMNKPKMNYIKELIYYQMSYGKSLKKEKNSTLRKGKRLWRVDGLNMNWLS